MSSCVFFFFVVPHSFLTVFRCRVIKDGIDLELDLNLNLQGVEITETIPGLDQDHIHMKEIKRENWIPMCLTITVHTGTFLNLIE